METFLEFGVRLILILQSLGEWLIIPMRAFTFLGNEEFYLFVAPVVYWCLDASLGLRLGLFLMISGAVNSALKLVFHGPRPYWYDPRVRLLGTGETSFGAPSGHAQNSVIVWGTLAAWIGRRWAWISAIILIFFVGFSRMILGLHFTHDVVVGWVIGALLLWLLLAFEDRVSAWLNRYQPAEQILIAFGASLLLILPGALARLSLVNWTLPEIWSQVAAAAALQEEPIAPLAISGLITNSGTFFGLAAGAILLKTRGGFDAGGPVLKRVVRFLLGLVGVYLFWAGLGSIFPSGEELLPFLLRYIRYGLVGFWISGLGPMLFIRLRLAEPEN